MSKKKSAVTAFAPASVANVGCGFDVLGFAIYGPGDDVEATIRPEPGVSIRSIEGDGGKLPLDPIQNTAGRAVLSLLESMETPPSHGIELAIRKKMPLGSGLGSSAASSVAAAVAANRLLGDPFTKEELLPFVLQGEVAASGTPHADNVSASLLGGFILVRSNDPLDVIELKTEMKLYCTLVHPKIEIPTKNTRMILRKEVPLAKAIAQWGNVGALVAGLYKKDPDLIGRSLQDGIVEPTRSFLIPGFDRMKEAALDAGALGFGISGAGPSVFTLNRDPKTATRVGQAVGTILEQLGLEYDIIESPINHEGASIVEEK
ncbi:MAG: homoserine kinase [Bacteroidota bacterium]